jgi:hypothetical protein
MPQDYGDEEDWKEHFDFLLTAYKDKRYIKVDNKPLFIIYRSGSIPRCEEMLRYWQNLAVQNGLDGIYFVQTMNVFKNSPVSSFDACVEFEPSYSLFLTNMGNRFAKTVDGYHQKLTILDYDEFWEYILERAETNINKKTFLGAFVDWDNTARIGNRALIFQGSTPEKFGKYLN